MIYGDLTARAAAAGRGGSALPMEAGPMQGIAEAIDGKEEAGRNGFTPAPAIDSPRKQSLTVAASDPAIRRGRHCLVQWQAAAHDVSILIRAKDGG